MPLFKGSNPLTTEIDAMAGASWRSKLTEMEDWYVEFLRDQVKALASLEREYAPHAPLLSRLQGRILDVGGGVGPAARYLEDGCSYTVIDPSDVWQTPEWQAFGEAFRGTGRAVEYVVGVGERLPFDDDEFDSVLCMWALNHAGDWRSCVREMVRVVKRGGKVLIVLEDMEPDIVDLARLAWSRLALRLRLPATVPYFHNEKVPSNFKSLVRQKMTSKSWPIQDDHIEIVEKELYKCLDKRTRVCAREWKDGFLAIELCKYQSSSM